MSGLMHDQKGERGMNEAEKYWASFFRDICPYTGKKCEVWNCNECEVEKAEREWMEKEEECPYYDSEVETCRRSIVEKEN